MAGGAAVAAAAALVSAVKADVESAVLAANAADVASDAKELDVVGAPLREGFAADAKAVEKRAEKVIVKIREYSRNTPSIFSLEKSKHIKSKIDIIVKGRAKDILPTFDALVQKTLAEHDRAIEVMRNININNVSLFTFRNAQSKLAHHTTSVSALVSKRARVENALKSVREGVVNALDTENYAESRSVEFETKTDVLTNSQIRSIGGAFVKTAAILAGAALIVSPIIQKMALKTVVLNIGVPLAKLYMGNTEYEKSMNKFKLRTKKSDERDRLDRIETTRHPIIAEIAEYKKFMQDN